LKGEIAYFKEYKNQMSHSHMFITWRRKGEGARGSNPGKGINLLTSLTTNICLKKNMFNHILMECVV
jgi:hypothetical protein